MVVVGQLQRDDIGQQFLRISVTAEVLAPLAVPWELIHGISILLAEAPVDVFADFAQRSCERFAAAGPAKRAMVSLGVSGDETSDPVIIDAISANELS